MGMWFGRRVDGQLLSELLSESISAGPVQRWVVALDWQSHCSCRWVYQGWREDLSRRRS